MSPGFRLYLVVVALAALAGCSDDIAVVDAGPDGGADANVDGGVGDVTAPNIPWLGEGVPPIMLTPCPEGWREVLGADVTECAPYAEGGAAACAFGQAHFPGEAGCRPIGAACPSGDYNPSVPTTGPVVYVDAAASPGGDGALATPFAALSDVPWATLSADVTVALARGTYPGVLSLKAGVRVVGACAAETVVVGVDAPVPAVVTVSSAGEPAVVESLAIRGAPQRGASVQGGRRLDLRGVLVDGARGVGVFADGAGTEVRLTDVVIRGTRRLGTAATEAGLGLHLQEAAGLDATRLILSENHSVGVSATGDGTVVTLVGAVIRDTQPAEADSFLGHGIHAEFGARVDASALLVSGSRDVGVFAIDVGTVVTLTDAVIRETEFRAADGQGGRGLAAEEGAEVSATRVVFADNREQGVFVSDASSDAQLTDVVIRGALTEESGVVAAYGVSLQYGASGSASRMLVSGAALTSVSILGEGSSMSVADVVVRRSAMSSLGGIRGIGVAAQEGAHFDASRLFVTEAEAVGIFARDERTSVDLADVVIRDTRPRTIDGQLGRGMQAELGAAVEGRRLQIERSYQLGVVAAVGAIVSLSDTVVRDVEASACASATCPRATFGYGATVFAGSLTMTRFQILDAELCGVMVDAFDAPPEATALDLSFGLIARAGIGACIQFEGYDLGRLTNDVQYRENGTNLDASALPVPSAVGSTVL